MLKKTIFLLLLMIFTANLFAQRFPIPVINKEYTVKAKNDTLWVINNTQMKNVIKQGKELNILRNENNLLRQKIDLLEEKNAELDSLSNLYRKDRDFYIAQNDSLKKNCNILLDEVDRLDKRNKLTPFIAGGSAIVGLLIGIFVF